MKSFNALIEKGHSIIVVEHNLELIKCADYIIDLGPEGGENGGHIVSKGTPEEIANDKASVTGKYLRGKTPLNLSSFYLIKHKRRNPHSNNCQWNNKA